jgi:DNA-binding beta-propeller fold protein YncE/cytochrome b involved in lipid metabolism
MEFLTNIDIHFVYLFIFTLGLSFGTGAALLGNVLFFVAAKDRRISRDEFSMIKSARTVGWFGILLYSFAGLGLFTLAYESMLQLELFYASMLIVGILVVNSLIFHFYHIPEIEKSISEPAEEEKLSYGAYILISEVVAIVSWIFLNLYHSMHRSEVGFFAFLAMYLFIMFVGVCATRFLFRKRLDRKDLFTMRVFGATAAVLAIILMIIGSTLGTPTYDDDQEEKTKTEESAKATLPVYTPEEIALHNNTEDCWVNIDDMVFDATTAAERYPEIYSCGEDVTENYREVTPEGISDRMMKYQVGFVGYTREEVALHDKNKSDCWLIIDEFVFDATKESKLHPAAFHCGGDATENYHKNHGDGISNKMMKYEIGRVSDGENSASVQSASAESGELNPYRELYVKEGSWKPENLMAIVEKDAEKLLFMDGSTNKEIGRIHDIGFQPHTSVFSPDAKYMYIIARDGWLTKIDLKTLKPVKSIKVGINSRGTALTDDGKYLAIGNYEPGNVVIVDPKSMKILKKIPTTGEIDGKQIESRVGAMIEKGDKIIAALKDLNSVWVIDTAKKGFPVIEKHWNIGNNKTPLHDAFLTPDGKFYIVASMGSNTVWVMNTDTWEEVAEVKTGETPHTGPGATWGNNVYVPALGEGLITVIDTRTWKPIKYIETAGPGLFVRAYGKNPDYPYVWAETAFGEFNDEIYVIDARINEIVKTIIPVKGESSWHPEFTNNGKYVYIVSQTANEVEVYDANTFEIVKRIEANTPSAVSSVGNRIEELGL